MTMEKIMKKVIPSGFETLCLGLRTDTVKGAENKYKILLLASKKAITRKWLAEDPPTVGDWIKVVLDIYIKLTFILRLDQDKFESYWKNLTNYIWTNRQDTG